MTTAAILETIDEKFKTIVEERLDDNGRRVQVTRQIRMRLVKEKVPEAVAIRRQWKKYGAAEGHPAGPNVGTTILGEPVLLNMSLSTDIDKDLVNKTPAEVTIKNVACRYCNGPHWTAQCPFKATFTDDGLDKKLSDAAKAAAAGTGKYVPPAQRLREAAEAAGKGADFKDQTNTIRITNLPDNVQDQDIRELCQAIGPVSRASLPKDQFTGRPRGFAFVTFHSMGDAQKAAKKLNGHLYGNMVILASMAADSPAK